MERARRHRASDCKDLQRPRALFRSPVLRNKVPAMRIKSLIAAAVLCTSAAACAPTLGPPPPRPTPGAVTFRADDFAWSQMAGKNSLSGRIAYAQGPVRFTCANSSVILTPETPWTRRRMSILYRSPDRAALPSDEVRARTPSAPEGGDYSAYIRRTTCDVSDRFSFSGLPDGAWFVISIARPADTKGPSVALMRRVVTSRGRAVVTEL